MAEDRAESLSEAFWQVSRQIRQLSREALAPWDVAPSQARAISVLKRHGDMRLSDLSTHLRVAPRTVTEVVDGLEERGFVGRRPDPHDRRATVVALTDDGHRVADAIRTARTAEGERFFGALSATDRAHLGRILGKLTE